MHLLTAQYTNKGQKAEKAKQVLQCPKGIAVKQPVHVKMVKMLINTKRETGTMKTLDIKSSLCWISRHQAHLPAWWGTIFSKFGGIALWMAEADPSEFHSPIGTEFCRALQMAVCLTGFPASLDLLMNASFAVVLRLVYLKATFPPKSRPICKFMVWNGCRPRLLKKGTWGYYLVFMILYFRQCWFWRRKKRHFKS